jgi:hypothetical protein
MTDHNTPVRTVGMNDVLVAMCWLYALSQLFFHPEQTLVWMASLLMALGYMLLLRTNGFVEAFRIWRGRTGLVVVGTAWILIVVEHHRT